MSKPVRFKPTKSAAGSWRLNIPAKYSETGQRQRFFYATRDLALAAASKFKDYKESFGTQTVGISPALAEQALAASKLLEPFGISLLEAASRVAEIERAATASMDLGKALKSFETAKADLSSKQTQAIRHMTAHLLLDFADRQIATITGNELAEHIEARTGGAVAFNSRLRLLVTFWRWCAKPPREWCKADTLAHIERQSENPGEVGTLTPAECSRLLQTAEGKMRDCVAPLAIALFTGLRQQEIERLLPQDITPEGITVRASTAKTKNRRFIQMPEPLAEWLKAFPIGKVVCPPNWTRKDKAIRRLAGWRVWSDLVPTLDQKQTAEPPQDAPEWPQNALRHTAASVMLALGKPLEALIFEHGHAGGTEMLRKHYIGRMPKADALKIWALRPGGKTAKVKLQTVKTA